MFLGEEYPAPGFRTATLGEPVRVGYYGYNWSSAISRTDGVFLSFDAKGLNPNHTGYRAYGRQLRCLSE